MSDKTSVLSRYPDYQATIGVEVHVQLKTVSKIFCACPNEFGATPNTHICPICTGAPGTLPVLNKKALEYAIMAGLATECKVNQTSEFARKHYFYPDLPKNYQTTQADKPICEHGNLLITRTDGLQKTIRINRIHMEEDAGKNIHSAGSESYVDFNRAGTPLIEIVSEPDLEDSEDVRAYLTQLHSIVKYLGICDGNMEEGSFRADVNVSVKKRAATALGTRIELKNINSFRFIVQAVEYEIERQIQTLTRGETLRQETRLWDSHNHKTFMMRTKESSYDYRYFTDPDLPLIIIDNDWLKRIKNSLPELPHAKYKRLQKEYELSAYEAEIICSEKALADYFEAATQACNNPKMASNWILRNVLGYLKEHKLAIEECPVSPAMLAELIQEITQGIINSSTAQDVFLDMATTQKYPSIIIQEKNLRQIGDESELQTIVLGVLSDHPDVVTTYKEGNERVFGFLVGQAMKKTGGRAQPQVIQGLLKKALSSE